MGNSSYHQDHLTRGHTQKCQLKAMTTIEQYLRIPQSLVAFVIYTVYNPGNGADAHLFIV